MTTLFSTSATIVTGTLAKSILSGTAAATSGVRGHINADVYRSALVSTINHAIMHARDEKLKAIKTQFGSNLSKYTVDAMIRDVNEYHQMCSLYYGIVAISDAVDKNGNTIDSQHKAAIEVADIDRRIEQLEAQKRGADDTSKKPIDEQIGALRARETEIWQTAYGAPTSASGSNLPKDTTGTNATSTTTGAQKTGS